MFQIAVRDEDHTMFYIKFMNSNRICLYIRFDHFNNDSFTIQTCQKNVSIGSISNVLQKGKESSKTVRTVKRWITNYM